MTGAAIARTGPDHRAAFRAATFADVLRSEWTKLRSVRSTFWALTVTVVLGIALGAVISAAAAHGYAKFSVAAKLSWDPTGVSQSGMLIAQAAELAARCREAGATVRAGSTSRVAAAPVAGPGAGTDPDVIEITGMDSAEVGRLAAAHGIALSELIPVRASLEEAFMELTRDSVQYQAAGAAR